MKKVSRISGLGFSGALMFCAVVCLGIAASAEAQTDATQYCEIKLSRCPEDYDGDTLKVPLSVVSLSSTIRACATTDSSITDQSEPPAIMFIIDNTTSMGMQGGNDTRGNRFRVAREIINSVYAKIPGAEIGVVVFDAGLFLNSGRVTDPNLAAFQGVPYYKPDSVAEQYMPLMKLNGPALPGGFYTGANPSPTALDLYNSMFVVSGSGQNGTGGIRNPNGTGANPTFTNGSGTNVSIAFEAALEQFDKTSIAPKNRYIIFISDGRYEMNVASNLAGGGCSGAAGTTVGNPSVGGGVYGNSVRCAKQRDFMAGQIGGKGIPTTYTVFLNTDAPDVMAGNRAVLDTMTMAIKANVAYSATNATSDIWTADGNDYQGLLTLMMDNILNQMLTQTENKPRSLVVTSAGVRDSAGNLVDTFSFNRMLPIDTTAVAPVNMGITYAVTVDSSYIDEVTGHDTTVTKTSTKRLEYNFYIQRTASPPANWAAGQGLVSTCEVKPSLALLYNGAPVTVIKGNMTNLTVQFVKGGDLLKYTQADVNDSVRVLMVNGTVKDTLYTKSLRLDDLGTDFRWDFVRAYVPNEQIVVGNSRLEHNTLEDSVVLFFRNPRIPLDTIRVAYPYVSLIMAFDVTRVDGTVTRVAPGDVLPGVKAGETIDIAALLLGNDGAIDAETLASGTVTWTLTPADGASLSTREGPGTQFMATKTGDYVVTATFVSGSTTITEKFTVRVVPGDPAHIQVVFSDPSVNPPPAQVPVSELEKNKQLEIPKGKNDTTLYVVERDKFGNYIGTVPSARWSKEGTGILFGGNSTAEGASTLVNREGNEFTAGNKIIVRKGDLVDTVDVTVVGDALASVGPNPFVPNVDSPKEIYERKYPQVYQYYKEILDKPAVGGGAGGPGGGGNTGIFVAGTAPKGIVTDSRGDPKATVVIYDAVGNVVFKSKPNEITLIKESNTFGFVWNGKNSKGRTVGPGTYLVRMNVELEGGKFFEQRKIGVTKAK